MANLILWRHAEAEVDSVTGKDADRVLTKRGRKDALKMATWLQQHLPENTEVLSSPARRCLETAAALQCVDTAHKTKRQQQSAPMKVSVCNFLSIESNVEVIAKNLINQLVNQTEGKTLLVVGHQPNLSLLILKLLGLNEQACSVKKGSVWWLRQRLVNAVLQTSLITVQSPNFL
jgi:phosphohistidine phosphatase